MAVLGIIWFPEPPLKLLCVCVCVFWPRTRLHVTWVSEWRRDTAGWFWVLWFHSPWGTAGPLQSCSPSALMTQETGNQHNSHMGHWLHTLLQPHTLSPARMSVFLAAMVLILTMPDSAAWRQTTNSCEILYRKIWKETWRVVKARDTQFIFP